MAGTLNPLNVKLCVVFAAFVFQLETFVMAVAMPSMAVHFQMSMAQIALVPILYLLAATIIFLPAGHWGDLYGLKRGFVAGAALLCVGTIFCGIAPNATVLLASRLLQGAGGGCMAALGYALIPARLPREHIGSAMGMVSFGAAAGLMTGAPLGGFLTEILSWRWAVLATVPVIGLLVWSAFWHVSDDPPVSEVITGHHAMLKSFLPSFVLGGLLLSLGLAPVWGFSSPGIIALLCATLAGAAILFEHEQRAKTPAITPLIWKQRALPKALITLCMVRFAVGGTAFLMPFYVEYVCGKTAMVSGLVLLGYTMSCGITGLFAGALSDRIGSRPLILAAMLIGAFTMAGLSLIAPMASIKWTALLMVFLGLGTGLFFSPNSRFTMSHAPRNQTGEVAALMALALNVGTAIGVAAFSALHAIPAVSSDGSRPYAGPMILGAILFVVAAMINRPKEAYSEKDIL